MKKKLNQGSAKKLTAKTKDEEASSNIEKPTIKVDSLDEDDQGFGGWLRSPDGLDTMKLFVISNTIVMILTLVFPHLQTVSGIIYEMVYGEDAI